MKKSIFVLIAACMLLSLQDLSSQDVYSVSSGEMLFQLSETVLGGVDVLERMRFTLFPHFGEYWHLDFGNSLGLYTGMALRNVGFTYDEDVPLQKTIRRSLNLGVPLAVKLGSFKHHFYLYGGGEYELLFHYKAKRWDSHDRDGTKRTEREWFSDKTQRFIPSAFVGAQLPGGFNIKVKYYLDDFLNLDYTGRDLGVDNVSFSDYTRHQMFYFSISWQLRTDKLRDKIKIDDIFADQ